MIKTTDFDLRQPPTGFTDDPFPHYQALQVQGPLLRLPDDTVFVTQHHACLEVYQNSTLISDKEHLFRPKFGQSPLYEHHTTSLVFNDPPYHARVRQTLVDALKPKRIQSTVDLLLPAVRQLIAEFSDQTEFDLLQGFAAKIPVMVICNLLGLPTSDRELLQRWSLSILGALEPSITPDQQAEGDQAVTDFLAYLRDFIADCKRGHGHPGDVLDSLLHETNDGQLTELELLHNCIFLLNAGHETTTNLIANGIHMLLAHADQLAKFDTLDRQSNSRLVVSTVEEVLRYQSPNQLGNREVGHAVQISGQTLESGTQVVLGIGAANRDPQCFPEPQTFDIERSPNPHLAFAAGDHRCAGMALARIEARIALAELIHTLPRLRLSSEPAYRSRLRFRGLQALWMRFA